MASKDLPARRGQWDRRDRLVLRDRHCLVAVT